MFRRPVEVSMAFDSVVAQLGQADGLLSGCINEADGFGVVGHSFGGYTSLVVAGASIDPVATQEMCDLGYSWLCNGVSQWGAENPGSVFTWNDERVWATAPMAPCGFEALVGGLQDITVPTLVLGGGMDQTCNIEYQIEAIYSKLKTPVRYMGVLPEGGHQAFSSVCEFGLDYQDCAPPFGNREMLHNRVRSTVLSFFGSARGDKRYNPWLNGVAGEMEWTQP
jgi:predicted dienelactone hydrolase